MPHDVNLRAATGDDAKDLLRLIRELAAYERMSDAVRATADDLRATLFGAHPAAEVIIADTREQPAVGFALFFPRYSTFLGQSGLWLEDLYVQPDFRGRGIGKALFLSVAGLAHARRCGRLEWNVLDWNAPSIAFYRSMGARPEDEWTTWRLTATGLAALASRSH
ncbi:MAG: GNAT family N-acetyltransferase [Oceanococcaceae bacterium]